MSIIAYKKTSLSGEVKTMYLVHAEGINRYTRKQG